MDTVKSAQRTLEVLNLLTAREEPMSFTGLAVSLGFPRSSLHGLLTTLTDSGWLRYDELARSYTLGIRALEAGNAYVRSLDLPSRAQPTITSVRDELNETVQVSVLDGRFNVYVAKVDGGQALRLASEVGRRLPAHATGLGKVLLAYLPVEEVNRRFASLSLEKFTDKTICTLPALRSSLTAIRAAGYGTDNEEYSIGVRCVAVPVRDHSGEVVAAMSVSAPTIRFERPRRRRALELLFQAADELSRELGYDADAIRLRGVV